jgi:hypothetical protein
MIAVGVDIFGADTGPITVGPAITLTGLRAGVLVTRDLELDTTSLMLLVGVDFIGLRDVLANL